MDFGYRVEVKKSITVEYGISLEKVEMYSFNKFIAGAVTDTTTNLGNTNNNVEENNVRMVMVNGKLYYDIGKISTMDGRCGVMDGKITSNVEINKIPTENDQSNFEGNYGYQYGKENQIEIFINDNWYVFETKDVEDKDFEIRFYDKHPEGVEKVYAILDKSETEKYDYSIFAYDGQVNILINGQETSLRDALLNDKITMEEIIEKANKDASNPISYDDGGSTEYHYKDGGTAEYHYLGYTIIKLHRLDGNRDVYIGAEDLNLNDIDLK